MRVDSSTKNLTPKQKEANLVLAGPHTHILLKGGARSGKTYELIRAICCRGMKEPESSHIVLRFRFNHLKASIIEDTLPRVFKTEFPEARYELNKSDWFARLPGGSPIWFGGLDDKERTEKVLGQGHSTIYLNEASQISWASRNKAVTRLSQKNKLRLRAYYDCNPPPQAHWLYKVFVQGIYPDTKQPIPDFADDYTMFSINPKDNAANIPEQTLKILENLPARERKRFWDGEWLPALESALWSLEMIEACRLAEGAHPPQFRKVVVSVDPSGCSGPEDKRSDEIGIIAAAEGIDGRGYVLEDASGRYSPLGWGAKAAELYHRYRADCVIGETNFGGAMVEAMIRTADPNIAYREVTASRGKHLRADPVAGLYERSMVTHCGEFPELEDQLCGFSTGGYTGERSPDRADALVHALTDLMIGMVPGIGMLEYYEQLAAKAPQISVPLIERSWNFDITPVAQDDLVEMLGPPGTAYGMTGIAYVAGADGRVRVRPEDVSPLMSSGYTRGAAA